MKSLSAAHELHVMKSPDRGEWWKGIFVALLSSMVWTVHLENKLQYVFGAYLHHVTKSQDAILEQLYIYY
jgi:hypothetical protein